MTPFELALESELQMEWQRFDSNWLFKWYGMTYEGGVTDVDDFKGGWIHYGGIVFGYQQQEIFWQAIGRYINQKVHEVFRRWDAETRTYPTEGRLSSLEGTERITHSFIRRLLNRARETAKRISKSATEGSYAPVLNGIAEASRLAQAHRQLLKGASPAEEASFRWKWKWLEDFYSNNKGLIWLCGAIVGGLTIVGPFVLRILGLL